MKMTTINTGEFFTFREGQSWIAAWKHYDVVEQGRSETEAVGNLIYTIGAQAIISAKSGELPFANVPKPADELLVQWETKHYESHRDAKSPLN